MRYEVNAVMDRGVEASKSFLGATQGISSSYPRGCAGTGSCHASATH